MPSSQLSFFFFTVSLQNIRIFLLKEGMFLCFQIYLLLHSQAKCLKQNLKCLCFCFLDIGKKTELNIPHLGAYGFPNLDVFLEKVQTVFDPPHPLTIFGN